MALLLLIVSACGMAGGPHTDWLSNAGAETGQGDCSSGAGRASYCYGL
jgi:hypothetical protein